MKQYNITFEERELPFGPLHVISLGERGRGRHETLVPIDGTITPDDLITPVPIKSGKVKLVKSNSNSDWIARISCEGTYTRNSTGYISVITNDVQPATVLASGHGADGDAGRIGKWIDYLLMIPDNTVLKVKRHGGYKIPPFYLFFGNKTVMKMSEAEFDAFNDNEVTFEVLQPIHY
jgi:hypothetical protein